MGLDGGTEVVRGLREVVFETRPSKTNSLQN